MLVRLPNNLSSFSREHLPSLYFSLILFGQVFLSLLLNIFNVENRLTMLAFRFSIMTLSFAFIFLNLIRKKFGYFLNLWVISVVAFWFLYLARLFYDVHFSAVQLALPAWELIAWSLGSSLPIVICSYLYAAQNNIDFILSKSVKHGIFMLGVSIIIFLFKPGLSQGAFYFEHLNPITCANAGCALFLLCFSRILLKKIGQLNIRASWLISLLGISIGLFITLFSATRGVILAVCLIVAVSIFCFRSQLRLSALFRWKYIRCLSFHCA